MTSRILPVIFMLIAFGLFFGYVGPTYSGNIAALRGEIRSYDAALAASKAYTAKAGQIAETRSAIPEEDLARLEAFLPDGVDNVQLIVDLDALAERSGITLSGFDVEGPGEDGGSENALMLESEGSVESLAIGVTAVGDYNSFKTFLGSVERSLRPLDLIALSLDDSETGVYTYDLTFRIYWLR
jgi:hypothetical protein